MWMKVLGAIAAVLIVFLGYVSTRPSAFHYERSGLISAPPEKIFPYLSNFKLGKAWSPFEKVDPNIKETYSGADGQVVEGLAVGAA